MTLEIHTYRHDPQTVTIKDGATDDEIIVAVSKKTNFKSWFAFS